MLKKINYSAIKLDRNLPVPLFTQLEAELRRLIGELPLDSREKLLSERKTAELLNIDRSTVSKAFAELKRSGIVRQSSIRTLSLSPEGRRQQLQPFPNIGIIIPDKFSFRSEGGNQIAQEYIKGILDGAAANRFATIMLPLPDANLPAAEINRFINETAGRAAGIIHLGDRMLYPDSPLQKLMRFKELPQVIVAAETEYPNILQVLPDIRPGAEQLAKKLLSLDLKQVGFTCYGTDFENFSAMPYFQYSSFKRPAGFREIFSAMGLECRDEFHLFSCSNYPAVLKNLLLKMESGTLPQIYCCHNDECANWMLRACSEIGLRVPGDLSVTGFDGLDTAGEGSLATIRLPFYEIGRKALEVLLEYYRSGTFPAPGIFSVQTTFIDGKTLGKNFRSTTK